MTQLLDKAAPLTTARKYLADEFAHRDASRLVYNGEQFYHWNATAHEVLNDAALRAGVYLWLDCHEHERTMPGGAIIRQPFKPTKGNVDQVMDALKAAAHAAVTPPAWLSDATGLPDPTELLVAPNGIFDLAGDEPRRLSAPTPLLFTCNALDYPVDLRNVCPPVAWMGFLAQLFPNDPEAIDLLAEWFGYCLTGDTSQQKMLCLVGPKRSGKGTIARILTRLLGVANVCGPTLSGLATNFGLWSLIGKRLAIVSDARLSSRSDQAIITERLLSISGEDSLTIDRKNLPPVTLRLPTRVMICTNELPRLADTSGALANRFLVLVMHNSFFGREDTGLEARLTAELPGILCWALEGRQRLRARGRFEQPTTSQEAIQELEDLSSPAGAFVRDWCAVAPGHRISAKDLFEAWCCWCKDQGRDHPGDAAGFGRNLRATVPGITTTQPRMNGERHRFYEGIDLTTLAHETLSHERSARQMNGNRWGAAV